jgi:glucose/arabinose dehydrogenase
LAPGFCASIYADSLSGVRQIAVAPNGDVFVATQGRGGNGIVALRGKERAETRETFANGFRSSHLALFGNHLYTEVQPPLVQRGAGAPTSPPGTTMIVRYPIKVGDLKPAGAPDTIVQGLIAGPGHSTRNFAIDRSGALYVNIGSATNSCENPPRQPRAAGNNPCTEADTRAVIWKFDANKTHQQAGPSNAYARGIRNAVGIAIGPDGRLWATQHGRDDLQGWFKQLNMDSVAALTYGADNPAEQLMQVNQGDDYGWPYCYFSRVENKLVESPEYGGDGKKVGQCASKKTPVATFPGHWAPNGLFFSTGAQLPAKYKSGAFIAFHGSWNRAPEPQGGYVVVFQPLNNGRAAGKYEIVADFAPNLAPKAAGSPHRPTAVAQMADGSLLVADDAGGRIYRITYKP